MRVGIGEDLHRVDDARPLVLGGVIIEEGPGLSGHSDADVLLHAITDAVLGAASLGDIGMGKIVPPDQQTIIKAIVAKRRNQKVTESLASAAGSV